MDKPTINEQIEYVKKQLEVVAQIHDLLNMGKFNGSAAQNLVMGQAYMKGICQQIAAEVKRLEEVKAAEMTPTFTETLKAEITK